MLDLDARVHLEEIEAPALRVDDEFDGSGAAKAEALREAHGGLQQRIAQRRRQAGSRRLLDELLVAALHGAIALAQLDHSPRAVAQNLHFDMAGAVDEALPVDARVAECGPRLGGGQIEKRRQVFEAFDELQAATSAPAHRLDEQRYRDLA